MINYPQQQTESHLNDQYDSKFNNKLNNFGVNEFTNQFDVIKNKKNFTVAVRIKPEFNVQPANLVNLQIRKISQKSDQLKLSIDGKRFQYNSYGQNNQKKFVFDKVYESSSQNHQIFVSLIERKLTLLEKGVNLSIMAYGATNSGKTYTIFGKKQDDIDKKSSIYGLSFMTFKKVFEMYDQDYNIAFSFVQVYNENVYDLLNLESITNPLNVMEDFDGNTNVIGLNKIQISSVSQLQKLIFEGNQARISSSNLQNIHSSRSHAFMELQLKHKCTNQRTKMVIVDLAGSQKYLYNSSVNGNNILKQGSNINKSLLSLGNCIKSLYQNDQHIPYRDSKLTRLLKQNLSGYAHNIMIACINKKVCNIEENMNSLNYALKAIKIEKQIIRKVQNQQLSEYQCSNCQQKLPYSLIKQINKHQQHRKRVKTRQSQSLSISPISKSGNEFLLFKSQSPNSGFKSSYKKMDKIIDKVFENLLNKIAQNSLDNSILNELLNKEKKTLKEELKEKICNSKSKNQIKYDLSNNNILVSEFDSPLQKNQPLNEVITQRSNITHGQGVKKQRRLKISLSKPKKQLQNTAASNVSRQTNDKSCLSSDNVIDDRNDDQNKRQNSRKNYIRIQDQGSCMGDNECSINSFRSNLTVNILDDKDKVLNQRKKVLQQASYNQRRNNNQVSSILRFKSTQNNLKTKNIDNFINSKQNISNKIRYNINTKQNNIKIQDQNCDIRSFDQFMINERMLDSTSIAPRMKRDQQDLQAWRNIFIKNIQSPVSIFKQQIQQSFVQYKINPNQKPSHIFKTFKY